MNTDDLIIELGKRVLKIRQKLSISQSDLAQRAELSKTYLGEFERGQRTNISISVIARIADSLGVTMSELFDDIERPDVSWENDDTIANTLYQKKLEDACYPPAFEGVPVTTLMQFLVYLPLLQPRYIIDITTRSILRKMSENSFCALHRNMMTVFLKRVSKGNWAFVTNWHV